MGKESPVSVSGQEDRGLCVLQFLSKMASFVFVVVLLDQEGDTEARLFIATSR